MVSSFRLNRHISALRVTALCLWPAIAAPALAADPLASNNGLYPEDWQGRYNVANLNYPQMPGASAFTASVATGPLTPETAPDYARWLKAQLRPTLSALVNTPDKWDPVAAGWYDLVWSGEGTPGPDGVDPTSGREALMNTYSGQIIPAETFAPPYQPATPVQNHAVIYYNSAAAVMLGKVWANIYQPNIHEVDFPDGSIVAKVEAVTNSPANWNVLDGTTEWYVYRPTTEDQANGVTPLKPQVIPVRPFQMAIKVKDTTAAPGSGWVWAAFVYDAQSDGATAWDRFVPVGLQWGNDPDLTGDPSGLPPGSALKETWINPDAPAFTRDSLGWGGRLAGPMDVATRHNVVTVSGERYRGDDAIRASSCQSCHGASEHPFTANLYPSPNRSFPRDGNLFLLYDPGSAQWARWFQNRPGRDAITGGAGLRGLDYDMALMFALSSFNAAIGKEELVVKRFHVH